MAQMTLLSFANLTCRFGQTFVMTDLLNEVIFPAFFEEGLERQYGQSSYFFRNVGLVDIEIDDNKFPQLTIYGRLIKNTVLTRTQIYTPEFGLVPSEGFLESAPSSFFALDLNNHKLMFAPETPSAPSLSNFATTLQSFARRQLESYIRAQHAVLQNTPEPKSFRQLREEFPRPDVQVTPLASEGTVTSFIETFNVLNRVQFKLLSTNAELPQGDNFKRIREMKDAARADTTSVIHEAKKGLNKAEITREATEAAQSGNQKILLRGLAEDGTVLRGNNEDLKMQVPFVDPPENLAQRATSAVRAFFNQITAGRLKPDMGTVPTQQLENAREKFGDRIEHS
jgi:hypothetical protein